MPEFNASVDHQLSVADATEKLKTFLDHVRQEYGEQVSRLDGTWESNVLTFTLTTFGLDIEGVLTVGENTAVVDGTLPFMALAFRGRIEESIKQNLTKALEA